MIIRRYNTIPREGEREKEREREREREREILNKMILAYQRVTDIFKLQTGLRLGTPKYLSIQNILSHKVRGGGGYMCRLAKATSWESKLAYNPQTHQCGQVGQTV